MSAPTEPLRPAWVDYSAVQFIVGLENGATVIRYPGGPKAVKWRSDCPTCQRYGSGDAYFWPAHDAMRGCRSGGRDHCTCDGCF